MVDIFDEIGEELRAERAKKLFAQYGALMVVAVVVIVLGVAGWQGWRWWQARQDLAVASRYVAAMTVADSAHGGTKARRAATAEFQSLTNASPEGYRTLARLRAAALKARAGDIADASRLWDQVAADGSAEPLLRDLANLLWAQHQLDTGDPHLVAARLKALAMAGNPWEALAKEQLALLDLRQGKTDAAKTTLRKLAQDVAAPNGLRARAAGLVAELGG